VATDVAEKELIKFDVPVITIERCRTIATQFGHLVCK